MKEPNSIASQKETYTHSDMINVIHALGNDPSINLRANMLKFRDLYKEKGIDLEKWYSEHKTTSKRDKIRESFAEGKDIGTVANLAEALPLYANAPGRLGDYIEAHVTKTARQDDQGNSFIDFVIEVKNDWLAKEAPKELQNAPASMVFLVDMTVNGGDMLHDKEHSLRKEHLDKGERTNVKCYKTKFGDLGIDRPKIIVARTEGYIEKVGRTLGNGITRVASDKFTIKNPEKFNEQYREYFLDLMSAIGENAFSNIEYMKSLPPDPKRQTLINEYQKIINFVEAYKKTPAHKPQA